MHSLGLLACWLLSPFMQLPWHFCLSSPARCALPAWLLLQTITLFSVASRSTWHATHARVRQGHHICLASCPLAHIQQRDAKLLLCSGHLLRSFLSAQMAFCRAPTGAANRPGRWGDLTVDLLLAVARLLTDADVQARPCLVLATVRWWCWRSTVPVCSLPVKAWLCLCPFAEHCQCCMRKCALLL